MVVPTLLILPEGLVTRPASLPEPCNYARSVLLKPGVLAEQTSSNVAAFVDAQKTPVHAEIHIENQI